jgi:L-fuconolactonase
MTPPVIDAHVHLWDLAVRPQPWADPFPALHRSFLIDDLRAVLAENGVDAAVVVQAGDSYDETLELLAIAAENAVVAGVVGWVDLLTADVGAQVAGLQAASGGDRLVGVRHQLQYEPDRSWLRRDAVRSGLAVLAAHDLCFDLVITCDQLPDVIDAVAESPSVRFVLDHAGKPGIAQQDLATWHGDVARLAALPNVACKLSGLVTEADHAAWQQADLDPVIARVLETFGPDRVMAGSDWPVCLLAADYASVRATLAPALGELSPSAREDVLGGTAQRWYFGGGR